MPRHPTALAASETALPIRPRRESSALLDFPQAAGLYLNDRPGERRPGRNGRERNAMTTQTLDNLRQHELVILRRLQHGPLTEFELAQEVAEHSGWTPESAADQIGGWLDSLKDDGLVWAGRLYNDGGQHIYASALTRRGQELLG